MKRFLVAALLIVGVGSTGTAFAHARLKRAEPGAGAHVAAPPKAITIEFTEGVVPRFSGIILRDATGKAVATGTPANGAGKAILVVPITGTLPAGTYTVDWHAVSTDTHRTKGSFSFVVVP